MLDPACITAEIITEVQFDEINESPGGNTKQQAQGIIEAGNQSLQDFLTGLFCILFQRRVTAIKPSLKASPEPPKRLSFNLFNKVTPVILSRNSIKVDLIFNSWFSILCKYLCFRNSISSKSLFFFLFISQVFKFI